MAAGRAADGPRQAQGRGAAAAGPAKTTAAARRAAALAGWDGAGGMPRRRSERQQILHLQHMHASERGAAAGRRATPEEAGTGKQHGPQGPREAKEAQAQEAQPAQPPPQQAPQHELALQQSGRSPSDEGRQQLSQGGKRRRAAEKATRSRSLSSADQTRRLHVMLVEEDAASRRRTGEMLEACRYTVTAVESAAEAIKVLEAAVAGDDEDAQDAPFDLVLCDQLRGPVSHNGSNAGSGSGNILTESGSGSEEQQTERCLDVLKAVREGPFPRIPFICMSDDDDPASVMRTLEAGAADYLVKPVRTNELTILWQHIWRQQRQQRKNRPAAGDAATDGGGAGRAHDGGAGDGNAGSGGSDGSNDAGACGRCEQEEAAAGDAVGSGGSNGKSRSGAGHSGEQAGSGSENGTNAGSGNLCTKAGEQNTHNAATAHAAGGDDAVPAAVEAAATAEDVKRLAHSIGAIMYGSTAGELVAKSMGTAARAMDGEGGGKNVTVAQALEAAEAAVVAGHGGAHVWQWRGQGQRPPQAQQQGQPDGPDAAAKATEDTKKNSSEGAKAKSAKSVYEREVKEGTPQSQALDSAAGRPAPGRLSFLSSKDRQRKLGSGLLSAFGPVPQSPKRAAGQANDGPGALRSGDADQSNPKSDPTKAEEVGGSGNGDSGRNGGGAAGLPIDAAAQAAIADAARRLANFPPVMPVAPGAPYGYPIGTLPMHAAALASSMGANALSSMISLQSLPARDAAKRFDRGGKQLAAVGGARGGSEATKRGRSGPSGVRNRAKALKSHPGATPAPTKTAVTHSGAGRAGASGCASGSLQDTAGPDARAMSDPPAAPAAEPDAGTPEEERRAWRIQRPSGISDGTGAGTSTAGVAGAGATSSDHAPPATAPDGTVLPVRMDKEARAAALAKYRRKKKMRCFEKKVRYASRQRLAVQRPRYRGQFVKQLPPGEKWDHERAADAAAAAAAAAATAATVTAAAAEKRTAASGRRRAGKAAPASKLDAEAAARVAAAEATDQEGSDAGYA